MDALGTVFYLDPMNKYATEIVRDPANGNRRCLDPDNPTKSFLRIGLDQQPKTPPHLARFGRRECNDVILNIRFSRNDQCYFDFNKETGELLLHDISEKGDTELYDIDETKKDKKGRAQIWKTPRQCVVVLARDSYRNPIDNPDDNPDDNPERQWILKIRNAEFLLRPRRTQSDRDEVACAEERQAFACQPDPDRTFEGTMQRLITLGLQSLQSEGLTTTYQPSSTVNTHDTRFQTELQPEEDEVIRYTKLGLLGSGGQGEVHKVVDMYNGNYYACKLVAVKAQVPEWNIYSPREFRARIEQEVYLVRELNHVSSLSTCLLSLR
jgi:hypothetical protein